MKREEILQLHTLTKEEQIEALKVSGVLRARKPNPIGMTNTGWMKECRVYESLADCAFRLREPKLDYWWNLLFVINFDTLAASTGEDLEGKIKIATLMTDIANKENRLDQRIGNAYCHGYVTPIREIRASLLAKLTSPSHPQA